MQEYSVGILIYRFLNNELQVLLGKCGGPKWTNRSIGAWNIPKGHKNESETDLECAIREFTEETSLKLDFQNSCDELIDLGEAKTKSGKCVRIFAMERNYNPSGYKVEINSNLVEIEWPPKSNNIIKVPELIDAYYFKIDVAKRMIFNYQRCFLDRLNDKLNIL